MHFIQMSTLATERQKQSRCLVAWFTMKCSWGTLVAFGGLVYQEVQSGYSCGLWWPSLPRSAVGVLLWPLVVWFTNKCSQGTLVAFGGVVYQ